MFSNAIQAGSDNAKNSLDDETSHSIVRNVGL